MSFGKKYMQETRHNLFIKRSSQTRSPRRHEVSLSARKFYASPNTMRVIKSRRMRGAWHVARIGEVRNAYRVLAGKIE